jgi:hypothetical protein
MIIRGIVAFLCILILAFVFNPGAPAHRDQLKQEIAERNQLAAVLRIGDLAALVSTYHSLGVASYSTINGDVVTVGAFGMVVVLQGRKP